MSKFLRITYAVTGLIFLAAALALLLTGAREGIPAAPALIGGLALLSAGLLFLLRPVRAKVRLEDDGTLFCSDGYAPGRRVPAADLESVRLMGGNRLLLRLKSGRQASLSFPFTGLESFLAELRTRGIRVEQ